MFSEKNGFITCFCRIVPSSLVWVGFILGSNNIFESTRAVSQYYFFSPEKEPAPWPYILLVETLILQHTGYWPFRKKKVQNCWMFWNKSSKGPESMFHGTLVLRQNISHILSSYIFICSIDLLQNRQEDVALSFLFFFSQLKGNCLGPFKPNQKALKVVGSTNQSTRYSNTVDGRNPAPPGMYETL